MKITTWNVNGIRAAIEKGLYNWIAEYSPDILCLQEIKARPEQLEEKYREMEGYQIFWHPAQRPGYSGVATFYKNAPVEISNDMDVEKFNDEGRLIRYRNDGFQLYNVYFPNGQRDEGRLGYKLEFYDQLLKECDLRHKNGEQLIITGDFNTAHNEIDLANPKENSKNSGFLPIEREWIDKYLSHGFVDVYRWLYPDKVEYTWWTYRFGARRKNVGWRLDYFLVSEALLPKVKEVIVHSDVLGSDHCPVTLILDD